MKAFLPPLPLHPSNLQITLKKYLYDVEANRPFLPSHHAENLATKIGCIIDLNEDDRINKEFYDMALKRIKVHGMMPV